MEIARYAVHRALTRPQMFAGVTYSYFIINAAVTTEIFLITRSFLALPAALQVVFRPKRAALYQCRFRLAVRAGESFEVLLRGRGTFEERDAAPA